MPAALTFVLAGAVIVVAGTRLAACADAIAARTGIGAAWIGAVLLASATSLPELATDLSAVRMGATDLALGDLFGSNMANMLILAIVDLSAPRRRVLRHVNLDHALSACLALALTAAATLLVLHPGPSVAGLGLGPVALLVMYLLGTRAVYRQTTRPGPAPDPHGQGAGPARSLPTLRRAVAGYAVAAIAILAVAPSFARSAEQIAVATGLGSTFVGTWLVGLATSLPELVASIAAVRLGALDLAVGNLFGSNCFNMAIFFALDLAQPVGPIFAAASPAHAITGLFGILLTSLGLAAIVYRAERRFAMIEPDSLAIALGYCIGIWVLYATRAG